MIRNQEDLIEITTFVFCVNHLLGIFFPSDMIFDLVTGGKLKQTPDKSRKKTFN